MGDARGDYGKQGLEEEKGSRSRLFVLDWTCAVYTFTTPPYQSCKPPGHSLLDPIVIESSSLRDLGDIDMLFRYGYFSDSN